MLNLSQIFEDGIFVFRNFSSFLTVPPLPATIFMMQRDVVNHYRYALTHYLTVPLEAHFLEDSSIGSPYEKWSQFTNDDFDMLAFAVHNLIRYTGRLGHETERESFRPRVRMADVHNSRIHYIGITVALADAKTGIGLHVEPDHVVTRTPFATWGPLIGALSQREGKDGVQTYYHITEDDDGIEHEKAISKEEADDLLRILRPERISIADRRALRRLRLSGIREVEALESLNDEFGDLCREYYGSSKVATRYDRLHECWWI